MEMAKLENKEAEQNRSYDLRGRNCPTRGVNRTGIPTQLKEHMEKSTGLSLDDVRVHYNSVRPAKLGALAYTQGNRVEIGPGQERHLPHELGHVIQQKLGVVRANAMHPSGMALNTDAGLERQADEIGAGKQNVIAQKMGVVGHFSLPLQLKKTPINLYAYGYDKNATYPTGGRAKDFDLQDVDDKITISDSKKGASTWDNPYRQKLDAIYFELNKGAELTDNGLDINKDTEPPGHYTIYPTAVPLTVRTFRKNFRGLGWKAILPEKNEEDEKKDRELELEASVLGIVDEIIDDISKNLINSLCVWQNRH